MNIFKRLFGKNNGDNVNVPVTDTNDTAQETTEVKVGPDIIDNSPEKFKAELFDSYRRYFATPDMHFDINLTDHDGVTYEPHEAFDATFEEWKKIRSKWDRYSVLYSFWDETDLGKLQTWQKLERYIKDRRALQGLDLFKAGGQDDLMDIRMVLAISKLHRMLLMNDQAIHYAGGAYKLRPDLDIVKVEYATTLHLSNLDTDKDRAHALINEVIEGLIARSTATEIGLLDHFLFSKGYIDSSVFAALFLNIGNCGQEEWAILSEEYYYCPIFRYEHATKLANDGETWLAFAKLMSLSEEFPWFKKALKTTIKAIEDLRKQANDPNLLKNELSKLEYNLSLNK